MLFVIVYHCGQAIKNQNNKSSSIPIDDERKTENEKSNNF
jgi:hypothetical protein